MSKRTFTDICEDVVEQAKKARGPFYLVPTHIVKEMIHVGFPEEVEIAKGKIGETDTKKVLAAEELARIRAKRDVLRAELKHLDESETFWIEEYEKCERKIAEVNVDVFPLVADGKLFEKTEVFRGDTKVQLVYDNTVNYV